MKILLRRNYGSFVTPFIIILINSPKLIDRKEFFFLFLILGIFIISVIISEFFRFYKIEKQQFYLETFFIKTDKIDIQTVKSINLEKGNWFSRDYLEIKYGKFDTSYVKPKNNKELIDEFLSVKPSIVVKL
jgi:hypothetical protein